jgi:hypothetical protein
MDRATFYASGTRAVQGITGLAAMGAAAAFLSPAEQGVFFSIAAMMQIQASAEMGMSVVLIQVASHEKVASGVSEGLVPAADVARARLGSLLRQSCLWTAVAAGVFLLVLAPLGCWFFSSTPKLHPQAPWLLAVTATAINLLPIPMLAVLEGCGAVAQAWRIRCWQQVASGVALPLALVAGLGTWALGMAGMITILATCVGMMCERAFFQAIWSSRQEDQRLRWWQDVWPFQWRISLSYLCGIFIVHFAVPSIYRICGAVEAGRFGLSFAAMRAVSSIALSNLSSKAQVLGSLVAIGNRSDLDRRFDASCKRSLMLGIGGLLSILIMFEVIGIFKPQWQGRALALAPMLVLSCAMILQHVTQCIAIYLRAHREEQLLIPSVLGAAALGVGFPLAAKEWGVIGVTYWYFATTLLLGTSIAIVLLYLKRSAHKAEAPAL